MLRSPSSAVSPIAKAILSGVPNKLHNTGVLKPRGFSKSKAGPFARKVRSLISVISRLGSIGSTTLNSSPRSSRNFINSRRSLYLEGVLDNFRVYHFRFMAPKNSLLFLYPFSFSTMNSAAVRSSISCSSFRRIHIRCNSDSSISSSSRRVPERRMFIAG